MTIFCIFFLETSAAHVVAANVVAANDLVEQCPSTVSESVCQPDPAIMQQHIEKGVVTSGRGKGKVRGKREMQSSHGTSTTYSHITQFYCFSSHSFVKLNIDPLVITSVY